jgi:hypothetical protein
MDAGNSIEVSKVRGQNIEQENGSGYGLHDLSQMRESLERNTSALKLLDEAFKVVLDASI